MHVILRGNYIFSHELQCIFTLPTWTTNCDTYELTYFAQNPTFISQRPFPSIKCVNSDGQRDISLYFMGAKLQWIVVYGGKVTGKPYELIAFDWRKGHLTDEMAPLTNEMVVHGVGWYS